MIAEYEVSQVGYSDWKNVYFDSASSYQYSGSVTSLVFSEGIKAVNTSAFYEMTSLTSITFPETMNSIGDYAFTSCDGLKTIKSNATVLALGADALKGKSAWDAIAANCIITVPDGCAANYAANTFDSTQTWTYWDQFYTDGNLHEAGSFTIGTTGYATYYNKYGYVMPQGVEGYVVDGVQGGVAHLVKVYVAGATVTPGIALLVKSADILTGDKTFFVDVLPACTEAWPSGVTTFLGGVQSTQTITAWDGDYYYYKLSNGENGLGWYWGATDGGVFELSAHRAFLAVVQSAGAKFISVDGTATAIHTIGMEQANMPTPAYNLSGQRVRANYKGIVIRNGKKFMMK